MTASAPDPTISPSVADRSATTDESLFQFEGRNIRLIDRDGDMWFVATDVARELGYREAFDLVRFLDADEKGPYTIRTLGGDQELSIISEPGLYRAVTLRRSNKKHDKSLTDRITRFQRWVFHDVLPSIRKTGRYEVAPIAPALPDFANPAEAARTWAEQFECRQQAEQLTVSLQAENKEMAVDVQALGLIAKADLRKKWRTEG